MTIADDWERYERENVPANAGEVQRDETRFAFYSGAWAVLQRMKRLGEPDVTEREGVERLALLIAECAAFERAANAGRA